MSDGTGIEWTDATWNPTPARRLPGAGVTTYAEPLAELLRSEATHAADLEQEEGGWDRYPPGACLLRLAQGVVDDAARPIRSTR